MSSPTDRLLHHLGLNREAPSRDFLDRIIREHQLSVPFETYTKILDYEPGVRRGDFMPPFAEYVDRIIKRGAGGLCWTLARGLQVLLEDLGFDASLMLMEPGHCCVRVDLDCALYADVGYAAPLFKAYPLLESFEIESERERFEYRIEADGITVIRTPGPTKKLDPTPRRLVDLRDRIDAANDWRSSDSFLHRLSYSRYVDGIFTRLRDTTLTRFFPGRSEVTEVRQEDAPEVLERVFGADPGLYREAVARREERGEE